MTLWGLHNAHPQLDLVGNGFISVGWEELGDLQNLPQDKDAVKQLVAETYPGVKPGAVPVWAGMILRFRFDMQPGDFVVYPYKPDSTLNFGRIDGDYYYETAAAELHPNRRRVEWLRTGIPRAQFSQGALYEVGSAITLFRVKNHAEEFLTFINGAPSAETVGVADGHAEQLPADKAVELAEDEPSVERLESYARDFIIEKLLHDIPGAQFEHFVGNLLRAMGYRAQVTKASGDGGVDVLAHRDPLGLEPPIIKVQCKRTVASIGSPDVQNLIGTLAQGGSELGLFVTLGSFSKSS